MTTQALRKASSAALLVLASLLLATATIRAEVLFFDDFAGNLDTGVDGLNGESTDSGAGTWVAGSYFSADGSFLAGSGTLGSSATLAFTPADGLVYILDARMTINSGSWVAFGFAKGQSTGASTYNRFVGGNTPLGLAWSLLKPDGSGSALTDGTTTNVAWTSGFTSPTVDVRVVLDTTGGAGNWEATWYGKDTGDSIYTEVRAAAGLTDEGIDSVGFAVTGSASGSLLSFSLSSSGGGSDTTNPELVSLNPSNGVAGVDVTTNLTVSFNETVQVGTGNITLRKADDTDVEVFVVATSTAVSISGSTLTIDPAADLDPATTYYVLIDATAIKDAADNPFAGISVAGSWSFTTASVVTGTISPYTADVHTRHLWHFDEADPGPAAPAAGVTGSFNLTPASGAVLGTASFPVFGTSGDTSAGSTAGFQGVAIPVGDLTGPDGAFTFEAMIRTSNITDIQQIISMENSSSSTADRPFQFRIDGGFLRFLNVSGGAQSILAVIPTSGDHAFVANEWFHVAVTYNGSESSPGNIKLYWTRVDPSWNAANEILSGNMTADLSGIATTLGVGQEYRSPSENFEGRIDEVRISDIARDADDFLILPVDTDEDRLADEWEIFHFRATPEETEAEILAKYDGLDDPDEDTYDNEAEETAGTYPNDINHTPYDADQDGYGDAWELATFGTIAYGPGDDPDGDGYTTAEELTAGTDPANILSDPDDTDADGLEDAVETTLFGDLSQGALDDFDDDGIGNLAELDAGTDPTDRTDYPLVAFIPVTDGNASTDENGYSGSAINSYSYAQNNLITVGDQQFISYYRRHATDANHPDNNTVLVARRSLGESVWEIFATDFTSANITDTHNVISMAIDGDGVLRMAWGVHGNSLRYARSSNSVLGTDPIVMVSLGTAGMTGQEGDVTYPKFQTLPDGDVIFLYREGGSGNGNWYLNRYDTTTDTWAPVHANSSGVQQPLMLGTGDSPNNCFYPDRMTLGPDGMLHLAGIFRYNDDSPTGQAGFQTNHRYVYLRSPDGGTTWQRSDGSSIDLPVVEAAWFQNLGASHVPEIVEDIPEGMSLMNQSGMTTDSAGRPIIANWWAADALSGDHTRQYHIFFHDGSTWQRRTVSARDMDPATPIPESQLRNYRMGRPLVITDGDDRIFVIYNDNRFDGITVVFSQPLAVDPDRNHWTRMNLSTENLGLWETTYDEERWKRDGVLQMLYQKLPGMGMDYGTQNDSTPVSVLEWNAYAYFNSPVRWLVDMESTPGQATVTARTRIGFRYDLRSSTDLDFSEPPAVSLPGDGAWWEFGTWPTNETRRFWRMDRTEVPTDDL
jgi:hypothetical protein